MFALRGSEQRRRAAQMFGNAGREHMELYGTKRRAVRVDRPEEPQALGRTTRTRSSSEEYTLEEIEEAPMVHEPLTKLQCCPTSTARRARSRLASEFVERARPRGAGGRDRRPGDGDRLREHVRGRRVHQDGRLRHDARRGAAGLRAGGGRPRGRRRDRAARLLLRQRAHHLRGARPLRRRARATS